MSVKVLHVYQHGHTLHQRKTFWKKIRGKYIIKAYYRNHDTAIPKRSVLQLRQPAILLPLNYCGSRELATPSGHGLQKAKPMFIMGIPPREKLC